MLVLVFALISLASGANFDVGVTIGVPNVCGDGVVDVGEEECDGVDLDGQNCVTRGYSSGVLDCMLVCTFDESACIIQLSDSVSGGGGGGGGGSIVVVKGNLSECNDGLDNDNDGLIDLNDLGCSNVFDISENEIICESVWECGEWSECNDGLESRRCLDISYCNVGYLRQESSSCFEVIEDYSKIVSQGGLEVLVGIIKGDKGGVYRAVFIGVSVIFLIAFIVLIVLLRRMFAVLRERGWRVIYAGNGDKKEFRELFIRRVVVKAKK